MPELPDLEGFRTYLAATSLHREIVAADVRTRWMLEGISPKRLQRELTGRSFESTHRHGKWLFVGTRPPGNLALHFGMTGHLEYYKPNGGAPEHTRMLLDFDNGYRLAYVCQRKLGHLAWVEDVERFCEEKNLGPDAMRVERKRFVEDLGGRRGRIKAALMGQHVVAGLGNVWVDEALFQTGIHPLATPKQLDRQTLERLYRVMRRVLRVAIREAVHGGRYPSGYIRGRRGEGEPCPRCDQPLERIKINQRSTYFCPQCQPE